VQYLQNQQHYIDRYDLNTIEQCLDVVKMFQEVYKKSLKSKELKELSEEEKLRNINLMLNQYLFSIMGRRYGDKQETIHRWMEEDRLKQDKQDYTPIPEHIKCPLCNGSMSFNSSKHLDYTYDSPIMRMMFLFKCSKCEKQQWIYDDGEIRISNPDLCPKCKEEINVNATRKGKIITWKQKCKRCGYTNTEIENLAKSDNAHKRWEAEQKKKESENKKLLEQYRNKYCLSDKDMKVEPSS
jgi:C4-type Zn-finger protein